MPDICVAFVAAAAAARVKVLLQKAKSGPPVTPPGGCPRPPGACGGPWPSTHRGMKRWPRARLCHLGDHLLDDGLAERVEVFRHQDEGAGAADDIVAIIILQAARWIGVVGIPSQRRVAENDETVDGDALGNGSVA